MTHDEVGNLRMVISVSIESVLSVCEDAYSVRTIKGYRSDLEIFKRWCTSKRCCWVPVAPRVLSAFIDEQISEYCFSTVKRRLYAIAFAHRMSDLADPTNHRIVQLAVRRAARLKTRRPKQVRGLTKEILSEIVAACPNTLSGLRDAALITVGYDTLCRSYELAMMEVRHVTLEGDESARVLIPRSKSDVAGDGRIAYLSPATARHLVRWLAQSKLQSGPLFRALHLMRPYDCALETSSIRRIVKRASKRAGFDAMMANELSGHSMRVGAAQDMMTAGFDTLAIMQAGGWHSADVVLRYVENAAMRELHARRWQLLFHD